MPPCCLGAPRAAILRALVTAQKTILIVDDDAGVRETLFYILRRDYRVLLSEDGADAVDLASSHKLDLAFVDVFLPDNNGFTVLERLSAHDVPVIMMSVVTEPEMVVQAMQRGAVHFIDKDFIPESVRDLVMSYLP